MPARSSVQSCGTTSVYKQNGIYKAVHHPVLVSVFAVGPALPPGRRTGAPTPRGSLRSSPPPPCAHGRGLGETYSLYCSVFGILSHGHGEEAAPT